MHMHETLKAFEQGSISAGNELRLLGRESARAWVIFMASILNGTRSYRKDRAFFEYEGDTFYLASAKKMFLFYSVEEEQDGTMCLMIYMAGRFKSHMSQDAYGSWTYDDAAAEAKRRILEDRR